MKESPEAGSGNVSPSGSASTLMESTESPSAEGDPRTKSRQLRSLSSRRQGIQRTPAVGRKIDSWRRLEIRSEARRDDASWQECRKPGQERGRDPDRGSAGRLECITDAQQVRIRWKTKICRRFAVDGPSAEGGGSRQRGETSSGFSGILIAGRHWNGVRSEEL